MTSVIVIAAILAVVFWLAKRQSDKAVGPLPSATYPYESEYEKLHKVGPITKYVEEIVPLPVPPKEIIIGGTPSSAGYQYYPDRDGWMRPWDEASFIPARLAPKWDRFIP